MKKFEIPLTHKTNLVLFFLEVSQHRLTSFPSNLVDPDLFLPERGTSKRLKTFPYANFRQSCVKGMFDDPCDGCLCSGLWLGRENSVGHSLAVYHLGL